MKKIITVSVLLIFLTCIFLISLVGMFYYEPGNIQGGEIYDDEYIIEGDSGFLSPMKAGYISSEFGLRWEKLHSGIDMYGANTSIYASAKGEVGAVGFDSSRGNYVYIHHVIEGKKYSTAYFHLSSKSKLNKFETVGTNTLVGYMGNTGNSFGAHLHFEILNGWYGETGYNKMNAINPRKFISYPEIEVYWEKRR